MTAQPTVTPAEIATAIDDADPDARHITAPLDGVVQGRQCLGPRERRCEERARRSSLSRGTM